MKKILIVIATIIIAIGVFFTGMKYDRFQYNDRCLDLGGGSNPGNYPICVINSEEDKEIIENEKYVEKVSSMLKFKKTPYVAKFHDKYFHSENSKINDQFFIGSVTKVFTSTLIFNLQKQKLLNIDDKVSKYLDNFSFNKDITIKELLTHTSGIREDESKFMIDSFQKQKEHFPISKVLKYAHQTKDKNYVYTNVNYMILGEIIKKITNQSFEKYVHKIIIKPLHLENTCIIYKDKNCNPTRGYTNLRTLGSGLSKVDKYVRVNDYTAFNDVAGSAGNLVSNIDDLEIFFQALMDNKFFDFKKMIETDKNGEYRNGLQYFGKTTYGHSGGTLDSSCIIAFDIKTKKMGILLTGNAHENLTSLFKYFKKK